MIDQVTLVGTNSHKIEKSEKDESELEGIKMKNYEIENTHLEKSENKMMI